MRRVATAAGVVAALALAPAAGEAVVSPTNCGKVSAKGKRYQVKSHRIACRIAKPAAKRFLETGRKPRGYTCRTFSPKQTKIRFRCFRGQKDFYAIRL